MISLKLVRCQSYNTRKMCMSVDNGTRCDEGMIDIQTNYSITRLHLNMGVHEKTPKPEDA